MTSVIAFALGALKYWRVILVALALGGSFIAGYRVRVHQDDSAQVQLLKARLNTLDFVDSMAAGRAAADADYISKLEQEARDVPKNDSPCLDLATARRVRAFRQAISGATPSAPGRVSNVLQGLRKRP